MINGKHLRRSFPLGGNAAHCPCVNKKNKGRVFMERRLLLAAAFLVVTSTVSAMAQTAPPTRVRGSIAGLSGNTLTVDSRDGQKLEITLKDPITVASVKKVELSSIEPNSF